VFPENLSKKFVRGLLKAKRMCSKTVRAATAARARALMMILSLLAADSRTPPSPSFVPSGVALPSVGVAVPWAWQRHRGGAVLALRGSGASETAKMLRVPWGGGQTLGGGMATMPEENVQGVDTATILRVPWRGNARSAGDLGTDAAGATELQSAGDSGAVDAGDDAVEAEGKTRSPNKLQQLLAECIRVLPRAGGPAQEPDLGEIPALLAQLSAEDLGAAGLTAARVARAGQGAHSQTYGLQ
jgi:hypothetical protein